MNLLVLFVESVKLHGSVKIKIVQYRFIRFSQRRANAFLIHMSNIDLCNKSCTSRPPAFVRRSVRLALQKL